MKITRRGILTAGAIAGGGFVIGTTGIGLFIHTYDRRSLQKDALNETSTRVVSQWITVEADGQVVILSPHTETGQGSQTGLLQIVLDEMDADPKRTSIRTAPPSPEFTHSDVLKGFILGETEFTDWTKRFVDKTFGRACHIGQVQFTGGSTTIRFSGWRGLRRAAASAREMFLTAGSDFLNLPKEELQTQNSTVTHKSGRSVSYGDLADIVAELPLPEEPVFKSPEEWKYIGTRYPRIDLPDKVFAQTKYGIDVDIPNLRYAAVAPVKMSQGRVLKIINFDDIVKRKGVEAVLNIDDAVAVVADNPWRAEQAAKAVKMECEPPVDGVLDTEVFQKKQIETIHHGEMSVLLAKGEALKEANVEAEYFAPYLAHTPMEPLNATLWKEGDVVHIATGVQDPLAARRFVAEQLEIPMEEVELHAHTMGGGFGRRSALAGVNLNWLRHVAQIFKIVGGAIKLIWSREADIRLSTFRPSDRVLMKGTLGEDGTISHWHSRMYAPVLQPKEATPLYDIPNITIESAQGEPMLPFSYWRSVDASTQCFFMECFVDELAGKAGKDPIEFRLSMLRTSSRHTRVLKHIEEMSNWKEHDSTKTALGIALTESFGSIVSQVAEVSVDNDVVRVHRVWCVIDCGMAINPASVEAQMESGIHYGLSAALYGQITVKDGEIRQSNFHNYQAVRFADAPRIDVDILTSPDDPIGGVGEPGTPPIAPAVANAIAKLAQRPRELPIQS